ncbi:MAG: hypothetical protein AAF334_03850, partial [Pseudomonadota bacterium]
RDLKVRLVRQRIGVHRGEGQTWTKIGGLTGAFIAPCSLWEEGTQGSFNGRFLPARQLPSDAPAGQRTNSSTPLAMFKY